MIMSFDHHAVACGAAALKAMKVDASTPDPAGGVIVRGVGTREPTGEMLESAAWWAWAQAPEPTEAQQSVQIAAAAQHLAALGFVEMHDMFSLPWLGRELAAMHDAERLPLRVGMYAPMEEIDEQIGQRGVIERDGVRLLGGKIFVDGTLNSRTAWMLEDFADPLEGLPRGKALMNVEQIGGALSRCAAAGLQLAAHAIGDGAVRACLDAAEQTGLGKSLRIEHAEIVDVRDVPRFVGLGVTLSVQPCHLLSDIEALRRSVPHRLARVLPLREFLDSGLVTGETLVFGSDAPVVRANPEDSIQAAVHRNRVGMDEDEAIARGQAISEREAWACFGV